MKTDFIDNDGRIYPSCTRAEALAESSSANPELRPLSQWTREENIAAAQHRLGEIGQDTCPACGKDFTRRITNMIVGCPACEPGSLETRDL